MGRLGSRYFYLSISPTFRATDGSHVIFQGIPCRKKKKCFSAKQILGSGSQPEITTVTRVRAGGSVEAKHRSLSTHGEIQKPRPGGRGT